MRAKGGHEKGLVLTERTLLKDGGILMITPTQISQSVNALMTGLTQLKRLDLVAQLTALHGQMLELQTQAAEAAQQLTAARARIADLEDTKARLAEMQFAHDAYWSGMPSLTSGPYCPRCMDDRRVSVHLLYDDRTGWLVCPVCSTSPRLATIEVGRMRKAQT